MSNADISVRLACGASSSGIVTINPGGDPCWLDVFLNSGASRATIQLKTTRRDLCLMAEGILAALDVPMVSDGVDDCNSSNDLVSDHLAVPCGASPDTDQEYALLPPHIRLATERARMNIVERFSMGDSIEGLARDYRVTPLEIECVIQDSLRPKRLERPGGPR